MADVYEWPGYSTGTYGQSLPDLSKSGGGGMDPMTWGYLGSEGLGFLEGLFDKGEDDISKNARWYGGKITEEQRYQQGLLTEWLRKTFGDRVGRVGLENKALDWQNRLAGQQYKHKDMLFRTLPDWLENVGGRLGKPISDPRANLGLMATAMQPYQQRLTASLGQRGMGGGGAQLGALGNLQNQYMAAPLYQGLQQENYARADRDNFLLNLQSSLFR